MENIDFILDNSYISPAPLDPHIASVWLSTKANRFIDGYDVDVSANFGTDIIELIDNELSISLPLSIKKASISIEVRNCHITTLLEGYSWEKECSEVSTESSNTQISAQTSATLGKVVSASAKFVAGHRLEHERVLKSAISKNKSWRPVGPNTIEVSDNGQILDGPILSSEKAWRVLPNKNESQIFILAQLTTRPQWIEFGEITDENTTGKLGRKISRWLKSRQNRDRELFELLLKALAVKGLQKNNSKDATLAVHLEVRQKIDLSHSETEEQTFSSISGAATRAISINGSTIDQYISAKPSDRINILNKAGVSEEEIGTVYKLRADQLIEGRVFNGGVSPHTALEGLEFALKHPDGVNAEEWNANNKSRCKQDLLALGLIEVRDFKIFPTTTLPISTDLALKHAAAKTPIMKLARDIILHDPHISAPSLGAELASEFKPDYTSDASRLRLGGSIRRWISYIEPHLFDPEIASKSSILLIADTHRKGKVGAPSRATPETLKFAQRELDSGTSPKEVAKMIGVSYAGIYRWKKIGLLKFRGRTKK